MLNGLSTIHTTLAPSNMTLRTRATSPQLPSDSVLMLHRSMESRRGLAQSNPPSPANGSQGNHRLPSLCRVRLEKQVFREQIPHARLRCPVPRWKPAKHIPTHYRLRRHVARLMSPLKAHIVPSSTLIMPILTWMMKTPKTKLNPQRLSYHL